ncbi:T-cell surface glycoprotein CD8 beta chain [Rhynchocyon petersi]
MKSDPQVASYLHPALPGLCPGSQDLYLPTAHRKVLAALCDGSALHQMPGSITVQTNQLAILSCETKIHPTNKRVYWLRQREAPSPHSRHEFLAFWDSKHQAAVYGQGVGLENLTVSQNGPRSTLNLTKMIPSDSGIYFCMTIGNPQLVFGKGTHLTVVDVLPTNTKPTRKPTPKKRVCRFPNSLTQKVFIVLSSYVNIFVNPEVFWTGSSCSPITLGLLVAAILILLVSLNMVIHRHCRWRRARLRFLKQ